MVYGELGRYPLDILIKTRIISYWYKLVSSTFTLSSILYKFMFILKTNDPSINLPLITVVQTILERTGLNFVWLSQKCTSKSFIKNNVKLKAILCNQFYQHWHECKSKSSKGYLYNMFKLSPSIETYLLQLPLDLRIWLTKIRTSNHRLPIETGRWFKVIL